VYFFRMVKKLVFKLVLIVMLASNVLAIVNADSSPVRVWGDFSTTYRTQDFTGDGTASNWRNSGTVNASSYIWRPWFALVNGGLTLTDDQSDFSDREESQNNYLTGNFLVDVFPTSRFPTQINYSQSRNEIDDNLQNRDITTTEFDLRQQYRSVDGRQRYRAEFNNNTREDDDFSDIEGNRLLFSSNHQIEQHSVGTDIQFDTVKNQANGDQTDSHSLTGRHSYDAGNYFSIENLVSTSADDNDFFASTTDVETAEFSSLLSWRPGNKDNINVTGNLRLSDTLLRRPDDETTPVDDSFRTDNTTTNINQGLLYQYSDNLLFRESINANSTESNGDEVLNARESAGFNYTSDRSTTRVGEYGLLFGSTYVNEHGDIESAQSINNQFSHSLDNRFGLQSGYQLRTNFTQSLGYDYESEMSNGENIDHSFSITWSESMIDNQSIVRFLISDSRSKDEDDDELFQLANLQYTGSLRLDRFSRLSGNLTLQWSNEEDDDDKTRRTVTNGQLEFTRARLFRIPQLVFSSRLLLSRQESETEEAIAAVNDTTENDESWENSLNYQVGRLVVRVDLDFIKVNGDYDRLFKLQLTRSFGDL